MAQDNATKDASSAESTRQALMDISTSTMSRVIRDAYEHELFRTKQLLSSANTYLAMLLSSAAGTLIIYIYRPERSLWISVVSSLILITALAAAVLLGSVHWSSRYHVAPPYAIMKDRIPEAFGTTDKSKWMSEREYMQASSLGQTLDSLRQVNDKRSGLLNTAALLTIAITIAAGLFAVALVILQTTT